MNVCEVIEPGEWKEWKHASQWLHFSFECLLSEDSQHFAFPGLDIFLAEDPVGEVILCYHERLNAAQQRHLDTAVAVFPDSIVRPRTAADHERLRWAARLAGALRVVGFVERIQGRLLDPHYWESGDPALLGTRQAIWNTIASMIVIGSVRSFVEEAFTRTRIPLDVGTILYFSRIRHDHTLFRTLTPQLIAKTEPEARPALASARFLQTLIAVMGVEGLAHHLGTLPYRRCPNIVVGPDGKQPVVNDDFGWLLMALATGSRPPLHLRYLPEADTWVLGQNDSFGQTEAELTMPDGPPGGFVDWLRTLRLRNIGRPSNAGEPSVTPKPSYSEAPAKVTAKSIHKLDRSYEKCLAWPV